MHATRSPLVCIVLTVVGLLAHPTPAVAEETWDAQRVQTVLKTLDERQALRGDMSTSAQVQWTAAGKAPVNLALSLYSRTDGRSAPMMVILYTAPKHARGAGFLRLDWNIWFYDAGVGRWERRTERGRMMGTATRRTDFDAWDLERNFTGKFVANEKLAQVPVTRLALTAKPDADVVAPVMHVWVDKDNNVLKRQELTLTGKVMRTLYYPKWKRAMSPTKKAEVWYPAETVIYEELETKGTATLKLSDAKFEPLPPNLFSKAWLESKSL